MDWKWLESWNGPLTGLTAYAQQCNRESSQSMWINWCVVSPCLGRSSTYHREVREGRVAFLVFLVSILMKVLKWFKSLVTSMEPFISLSTKRLVLTLSLVLVRIWDTHEIYLVLSSLEDTWGLTRRKWVKGKCRLISNFPCWYIQ